MRTKLLWGLTIPKHSLNSPFNWHLFLIYCISMPLFIFLSCVFLIFSASNSRHKFSFVTNPCITSCACFAFDMAKQNLNSFKERRSSQNENEHMKRSQSMSQQIADKAGDIMGLNHVFQQHQQSPIPSNASTPTTAHPYAPLQSPTLSLTNNST